MVYIIAKDYQKDKIVSALINNALVNLVVHFGVLLAQEADPITINKLKSNIEKHETAAIRIWSILL